MTIAITVQTENPGASATLFRLFINGQVVATGLNAAEARFVVDESLQRLARSQESKAHPGPNERRVYWEAKAPPRRRH